MNRFLCFALIGVFSGLSGCGGGAEGGKPVFPVTATITMDGAPLAGATVSFAPTQKGQPTAIGRSDQEGKITLTTYEYGDGAAEGKFNVVVRKSAPAAAADTSGDDDGHGAAYEAAPIGHSAPKKGGAADDSNSLVPDIYTSSKTTLLKAEVTASGDNVFVFEIK